MKMVIFHSYVSLPEGSEHNDHGSHGGTKVDKVVAAWRMCSDTSMPLGRVDRQTWRVNLNGLVDGKIYRKPWFLP